MQTLPVLHHEVQRKMKDEMNAYTIKQLAEAFGFDHCGIAKAEKLEDDARRLEAWLKNGFHGSMDYMANHFDLRVDPTLLVPGAKSVITLLKNYYPEMRQIADAPKISKYAFGTDYHLVIRNQLNSMLQALRNLTGDIAGRGFVDSAPVLERSWALRSGLGWVGKNGNLLTKHSGSFFFIATLITDLPLIPDDPFAKDYCGSCTRCIDACPTNAILPDKVVDGSRCISYFTIELKDALIPDEMKGRFDNWMFGCDICQDVCPWNRFSAPHDEPQFAAKEAILNFTVNDWEAITEEHFKKLFKDSPLSRTKWKGVMRNLKFMEG
jgi:epoxyqueuosine reductase